MIRGLGPGGSDKWGTGLGGTQPSRSRGHRDHGFRRYYYTWRVPIATRDTSLGSATCSTAIITPQLRRFFFFLYDCFSALESVAKKRWQKQPLHLWPAAAAPSRCSLKSLAVTRLHSEDETSRRSSDIVVTNAKCDPKESSQVINIDKYDRTLF